MYRTWLRDLVIGLTLAGAVGITTSAVTANHSIPTRMVFWDADRNHYPDLIPEPVRVGGTGWWNDARLRVNDAVSAWTATSWNVWSENAQGNYIIIDRGQLAMAASGRAEKLAAHAFT